MKTDLVKIDKLWNLIRECLGAINPTFMAHGERVAFYMLRYSNREQWSRKTTYRMVLLALFHDIGAYKTNQNENLLRFDAYDTYPHALSGYLFLKYFSPLKEDALPILYHHASCAEENGEPAFREGVLLHLMDRFDVLTAGGCSAREALQILTEYGGTEFYADQTEKFVELVRTEDIDGAIKKGTYLSELEKFFLSLDFSYEDSVEYLKMLVFTFELFSYATLFHSNTTATVAYRLGTLLGVSGKESQKLYLAGLIHDLGKIKTPIEILENPSALTAEEMQRMKLHVVDTAQMANGYFAPDVVTAATRHHEKLNGSGYPEGLIANDLSLSDKILCVSDIISALYTKRSYKDSFDNDTVERILLQMSEKEEIDILIVKTFLANRDFILNRVNTDNEEISARYLAAEEEYARLIAQPFGK